ncbi:MAG: hypothetical protein WCK25_03045 [Actinomycetes bacterium]
MAADGTETTMDPVNDTEINLESTTTAAEASDVSVATAEASPAKVTVTKLNPPITQRTAGVGCTKTVKRK